MDPNQGVPAQTSQPLPANPPQPPAPGAPLPLLPGMPPYPFYQPPPPPPPQGPIQIQLPGELQQIMQQWPKVMQRVEGLDERVKKTEEKPQGEKINRTLGAALAFFAGFNLCALLIFLWHYGALIFRV